MAIEVAMEEAHPYNNWSDFCIPSEQVYAYDTIQILPLNMQRGRFPEGKQCFNGLFIACSYCG